MAPRKPRKISKASPGSKRATRSTAKSTRVTSTVSRASAASAKPKSKVAKAISKRPIGRPKKAPTRDEDDEDDEDDEYDNMIFRELVEQARDRRNDWHGPIGRSAEERRENLRANDRRIAAEAAVAGRAHHSPTPSASPSLASPIEGTILPPGFVLPPPPRVQLPARSQSPAVQPPAAVRRHDYSHLTFAEMGKEIQGRRVRGVWGEIRTGRSRRQRLQALQQNDIAQLAEREQQASAPGGAPPPHVPTSPPTVANSDVDEADRQRQEAEDKRVEAEKKRQASEERKKQDVAEHERAEKLAAEHQVRKRETAKKTQRDEQKKAEEAQKQKDTEEVTASGGDPKAAARTFSYIILRPLGQIVLLPADCVRFMAMLFKMKGIKDVKEKEQKEKEQKEKEDAEKRRKDEISKMVAAYKKKLEDEKRERDAEEKRKEKEEKRKAEVRDKEQAMASRPTVDNVGPNNASFRQVNVIGDGWCFYRAFGLAYFYPHIIDPAGLERLQNTALERVRQRICEWWTQVVDRGNRESAESRARLPLYRALNEHGIGDRNLRPRLNLYHDRRLRDQDRADRYHDQHGAPPPPSPTPLPPSPTTLSDIAYRNLAAQIESLRTDRGRRLWADQTMQQIIADAFGTEVLIHSSQRQIDGTVEWNTTSRGLFGERQIHLFQYPSYAHYTHGRPSDESFVFTDHVRTDGAGRVPLFRDDHVRALYDQHYNELPDRFVRTSPPPPPDAAVSDRILIPADLANLAQCDRPRIEGQESQPIGQQPPLDRHQTGDGTSRDSQDSSKKRRSQSPNGTEAEGSPSKRSKLAKDVTGAVEDPQVTDPDQASWHERPLGCAGRLSPAASPEPGKQAEQDSEPAAEKDVGDDDDEGDKSGAGDDKPMIDRS